MLLLLGCMLLGALGVWADPWGIADDYVDDQTPANSGQKYLLRKVLDGQTLSIGLPHNEYTNGRYEKLSRLIEDSFNKWFSNTVRHIERSGRKMEFQDVMPVLQRGVSIQISEEGKDLNFWFLPLKELHEECGKGALGCYDGEEPVPEIYLPANDNLIKLQSLWQESRKSTTVHEIGHALGFSDQYVQARSVDSDQTYGSEGKQRNIMNHATHLTCDDADGIINLIDITRATRRGGDRGWKTLCPRSDTYYLGGMDASRGPLRIKLNEDYNSVELITFDKGQKISQQRYAFATPQGTVPWQETPESYVEQRDQFGRPVMATGPHGERIYYAYLFDRVDRLTVQNGQAVSFEKQVRYHHNQLAGEQKDYKQFFFGQKGVVCLLELSVFARRGYTSEYTQGVNQSTAVMYIKRSRDRHGNLTENVYQTPAADSQHKAAALRATSAASVGGNAGQVPNECVRNAADLLPCVSVAEQLEQWTQKTLQQLARENH